MTCCEGEMVHRYLHKALLLAAIIALSGYPESYKNTISGNLNDFSVYALAYERTLSFFRVRAAATYYWDYKWQYSYKRTIATSLGIRKEVFDHQNFNLYLLIDFKHKYSRVLTDWDRFNKDHPPDTSSAQTLKLPEKIINKLAASCGAGFEFYLSDRIVCLAEISPSFWHEWPPDTTYPAPSCLMEKSRNGFDLLSGNIGVGFKF
jgi:hypothetical protein